ncbi:DUF6233 domain-containing protein [Streptomyces sp. NPDC006733]|uniref:DUF6233 domain-containing protein n=1 Tax=Streptomyces sp. NPDC006733 TaxID=3155460 RepID=UPI0033F21047
MGEVQAPRDGRPVAVVHLPGGEVRECVVGRRLQAPDGTWWYELSPVPEPAATQVPSPLRGWPPPAAGWRANRRHLADGETWEIHRGGCWLSGETELTLERARALLASTSGVGCDVCDAAEGLRQPDEPVARDPQ